MNLLDMARQDIAKITGASGDFSIEITFTAPDATVKTVYGTHKKHHLKFDTDGAAVNGNVASVSVAESLLLAAPAYPVRNGDGHVSMKNHQVQCKDSTGVVRKYVVDETFPDETVGLIVFILGALE